MGCSDSGSLAADERGGGGRERESGGGRDGRASQKIEGRTVQTERRPNESEEEREIARGNVEVPTN